MEGDALALRSPGQTPWRWPSFRSLLVAAAALVFLAHALTYRGNLLDDAFISLRYAENLVAGHGLVWNPGERVEGYTNFLWVLLAALGLAAGVGAVAALQTVSALACLALVPLTAHLGRLAAPATALPAVVWLLAAESFGYYATTAMETTFFALLLALAVDLGLREARAGRRRGAVAVFGLLALTRPEGVMLFALGQVVFAGAERRLRGTCGLWRRAADIALFTAGIGAWVAWRLAYYGEFLPNTFHAKVTGGGEQLLGGLFYLRGWAFAHPVFALALAAPAVLLARPTWRARLALPELPALWALALVWVAYVAAIGGDSMPFHRFLLPLLPLCAAITSAVFAALSDIRPGLGRGRRPLWLAGLLLAVQLAAGLRSEEPMRAFVAHRTTLVGLETGRYLRQHRDPGDLLAVNTAGALPWASGLPSLDMLGLTEPDIARRGVYVISPRWSGHRRGWGAHVLARRPAVVVWYNSAGALEPHYLGDWELADNATFRFFYQLRRVELPAVAGESSGRLLRRFAGAPFGDGDRPHLAPDLGVRFEVSPPPRVRTAAYPTPIVFHYFERRRELEPLWPLAAAEGDDLDILLDAATARWRQAATPAFDPAARRAVERLCSEAAELVRAGETEAAKRLLSRAAERNGAARSPRVGQYVANLAVLERKLFLAVEAQLEALRLEPDNALYRRNLEHLLTVRYKEFIGRE